MDEKKVRNILEDVKLSSKEKEHIISECISNIRLFEDDDYAEHVYTVERAVPKRFPRVIAAVAACAVAVICGAFALKLTKDGSSNKEYYAATEETTEYVPPWGIVGSGFITDSYSDFKYVMPDLEEAIDKATGRSYVHVAGKGGAWIDGKGWKKINTLLQSNADKFKLTNSYPYYAESKFILNVANLYNVSFYDTEAGVYVRIFSVYSSDLMRNWYYLEDNSVYDEIYQVVSTASSDATLYPLAVPTFAQLAADTPNTASVKYDGEYYSLTLGDMAGADKIMNKAVSDNGIKYLTSLGDKPSSEPVKFEFFGYTIDIYKENVICVVSGAYNSEIPREKWYMVDKKYDLFNEILSYIYDFEESEGHPALKNLEMLVSPASVYKVYYYSDNKIAGIIGMNYSKRKELAELLKNCVISQSNRGGIPTFGENYELNAENSRLLIGSSGCLSITEHENTTVYDIESGGEAVLEYLEMLKNDTSEDVPSIESLVSRAESIVLDGDYDTFYINDRSYKPGQDKKNAMCEIMRESMSLDFCTFLPNSNGFTKFIAFSKGEERIELRDNVSAYYYKNGEEMAKFRISVMDFDKLYFKINDLMSAEPFGYNN